MRIRIRRWWRRDQQIQPVDPQPVRDREPERPGWVDEPTCLYDTVNPVRPYVIRECDG